jgi:hypothetical protein
LLLASCAWAGSAAAGTVFADPYGAGSPDVLGPGADFDIHSLEVQELSATKLQLMVNTNYHAVDATLAAFNEPGTSFADVPLSMGDVLIRGQSLLWAIPLSGTSSGPGIGYYSLATGPVIVGTPATRPTVTAGGLYQVNRFMTAGEVLGVASAADFRADENVWGEITQSTPTYSGFTAVGAVGSEVGVFVQIPIGPAFYNDVKDGYSIHFASTTCACDVLDARVPEPAPLALALGALALTAARARLFLLCRGGRRERALV